MAIQDLTANLDLKQNLNIYATCKQLDSLNLILRIYDNSVQADLTNYNVRLKAMKADNIPLIQEHVGITPTGNIVTVAADEQLTTTSGKTLIELQFINKTTGKKKATFNLALTVVPSTTEINGTISTATYTLLEELENKLDQAGDFLENISEAIEASNTLETTINNSVTAKNALDNSNSTANITKSALDAANILAEENIDYLDTKNATATNKISELETATTNAETKKQEVIAECLVADDKIAAMQAFGDVSEISQEIQQMQADIQANTTSLSEKAKQTDLDAVALYNATCTYASNVFTLTLVNVPTTLPSYFTVRVKMSNVWVDASTIKIGTKTYAVVNAAFVQDEVVTINFDNNEVSPKAFFKSGGGGLTETLPQQVVTFTATAGDGIITFNWTVSDNSYLSGFFLVYKQGSAPVNVNDGVKIDITNIVTTSQQVTGVTNDLSYTGRIFPYNSKKQAQTQYKIATATPYSGNIASNLAVGSKLTVGSYNFIIADKNHTGYPSNSVTLISQTSVTNMQFDSSNNNKFSISSIRTWLNSTFIGYLTALGSNILDTTIITALPTSGNESITAKAFLASTTELGLANENSIAEGNKLSYFNSNAIYLSGVAQFLRTPLYTSTVYTHFIDGGGSLGSDNSNISKGIRPLINISGNTKVSLVANGSGYYTLI